MDALELTRRPRWIGAAVLLLGTAGEVAAQQVAVQPDPHAPVRTRDSVLVQAPPPRVWAALTDVAGWPRRHSFIRAAAPPAAWQAGQTFRWQTEKLRLASELLHVVPGQELGWQGRKYGVLVRHSWYLRPAPGGGTWLVSAESQRGLLPWLLRRPFQQRLQAGTGLWLRELKAAAETAPATP